MGIQIERKVIYYVIATSYDKSDYIYLKDSGDITHSLFQTSWYTSEEEATQKLEEERLSNQEGVNQANKQIHKLRIQKIDIVKKLTDIESPTIFPNDPYDLKCEMQNINIKINETAEILNRLSGRLFILNHSKVYKVEISYENINNIVDAKIKVGKTIIFGEMKVDKND